MDKIVRVSNSHPDFQQLVDQLDAFLAERNGEVQKQYNPHNRLAPLPTAVIGYRDNIASGCGCFREHSADAVEIKRMFVRQEHRGSGLAATILCELEKWARELGYRCAVLETGKKQPEAIRFYQKLGYTETENFPPYVGMPISVCMRKQLPEPASTS